MSCETDGMNTFRWRAVVVDSAAPAVKPSPSRFHHNDVLAHDVAPARPF